MQARWSKLALPLVQVTSWGQVFKIHFLHWFIYQLSLHFTTLNKTVTKVTRMLLVRFPRDYLNEHGKVDAIISAGRFFTAQFQSYGKKSSCNNWVLVIIKCTLRLLILMTKRWEPRIHSALMFFLKFKLVQTTASAYQLYGIDHYHS